VKIRVEQYSGTIVANTSSIQFVTLVDPDISEFKTLKLEGTAAYEATIGERVTYSYFTICYDDKYKPLIWSGLRFHALTDGDYVMKLQEDKFLADEFYYTVIDSNGDRIATFGSDSMQIDLSDPDVFKHSKLLVFEQSFCSIADIKSRLVNSVQGRVKIGESKTEGNTNEITFDYVYQLIRETYAEMSIALARRYRLPIRVEVSEAENYLAMIASKKVCYELYVSLYPTAKFGDMPNAINRWKSDYEKFIKDIYKTPIKGIKSRLEDGVGTFQVARGD